MISQRIPSRMNLAKIAVITAVIMTIGAFAVLLAGGMSGPITHADEGSYLLGAAALAGGLQSSPVIGYYSGYSLLLVPAFLGTADIQTFYQHALWTNCALLMLGSLALFDLLSTLFPGQPIHRKLLAVLCMGLHPAALGYTQVSMAEVATIATLAIALALTARAITNGRAATLVFGAIAAGCLFLINPRGLFLASAPCLFIFGSFLLHALSARRTGLFFLAYIATLCLHGPLETLALKSDAAGSPYDYAAVLMNLADLSKAISIVANLLGNVLTIGIATCMLPFVYISHFDRRQWRMIGQAELVVCCLLAAAFLTAALTAIFFADQARADYLVYERYLAPCTVLLLAVSVMALLANRFHIGDRNFSWAITALLVAVALLFFLVDAQLLASTFNFLNAPSWYLWQDISGGFDILGCGLLAVAFVAFFLFVGQRSLYAATVGLVLFLAYQTFYFSNHYFHPQSRHADSSREIVHYLTKLDAARDEQICVDRLSGLDPWTSVDSQLFLMKYLTSWSYRRTCTLNFQVMPLADGEKSGFGLIVSDAKQKLGLYADKSDTSLLRLAGLALPAGFPAALPRSALVGDIQLIDGLPDELETGEKALVRVRVQHRGAGAIWPKTGDDKGLYAVRIGITYEKLPLGSKPRDEGRQNLHESLFPGESQELTVPIRAPSVPGEYRVCLGVLQEMVAWIRDSSSDADCANIHVNSNGEW